MRSSTPTKTLVIANSHAAALQCAMRSRYNSSSFPLKMIAKAGPEFGLLDIENGVISHSELLKNPIDYLQFDNIIIYGLQLLSRTNGGKWIKQVRDQDAGRFSSAALENAAIDDLLSTSSYQLAKKFYLDSSSSCRVICLPSPYPGELILAQKKQWENISDNKGWTQKIKNIYKSEFKKIDTEYHHLPKELLSDKNNFTTHQKFLNRKEDFSHINEMGGELVLDHILGMITP